MGKDLKERSFYNQYFLFCRQREELENLQRCNEM